MNPPIPRRLVALGKERGDGFASVGDGHRTGAVEQISPQQAQSQGVMAFHPPCTLQHGQQLKGGVESQLNALGFKLRVANNEAHLCCGSAGTYSVLQPTIATQLRDRKLGHLQEIQPQAILSANIGCITHLQSGTDLPVRHWVEMVDAALLTSAAHSSVA